MRPLDHPSVPDSIDNPYEVPKRALGPDVSHVHWAGIAVVYTAWCVGLSVAAGAARALLAGDALAAFDSRQYGSAIVALEALRGGGARAATAAAVVTFLAVLHGSPPVRPRSPSVPMPWQVFALVPVATPLAACATILAAVSIMRHAYGVPVEVSFREIGSTTKPLADLLRGIVSGCFLAAVAGAIATALVRTKVVANRGLVTKGILGIVSVGILGAALDAAFTAVYPW